MADPDSRHHLFQRALQQTGWTVQELWLGTVRFGGTTSVWDLDAFLYGLTLLPPAQQDIIAHTLNERLADLYESAKIAYLSGPGPSVGPAEDPLAVLREHLQAVPGTDPDE